MRESRTSGSERGKSRKGLTYLPKCEIEEFREKENLLKSGYGN